MAMLRPFKAYYPAKGEESKIAALPYDVYNRKEAREEVSRHPDSFLSIDRAETLLEDGIDLYDKRVYEAASERLQQWIQEKRFVQEETPCFYLYELTMEGRAQTGVVACASIDDYLNGIIKKHENTREEKEQDRICHVDVCNMQTGPIFLAYRQTDILRNFIRQYKQAHEVMFDFVSEDGICHRGWRIENPQDIDFLTEHFAQMNELYIADGHHRCASAVKVGLKRRQLQSKAETCESDYFLSVIFPDEELKIYDYNRVVKDLNGLDQKTFLEKVERSFEVIKQNGRVKPKKKGQFGMYLDHTWYLLTARAEICCEDPVKGLDVSILQDYLLGPILKIDDPRVDKRIDFVGGIRGLEELEKRVNQDMAVAFSMYPTSIDELFQVADAGLLMPPKSTWFEPKLRSGLFLHEL